MKLHLPVQLFRAVIALMAVAMPFSASAAQKYTVVGGQQLTLSGLDELDLDISGYYVSSTSGSTYGGAIYATGTGVVNIEHYVSVLFNKNYAKSTTSSYYDSYGGAIYSESGAITLSENESVTFSGNYASSSSSGAVGGAICSYRGSVSVALCDNGNVSFSDNFVLSYSSAAQGGAICDYGRTIMLKGNESVSFSNNYAQYSDSNDPADSDVFDLAEGGAICSYGSAITLIGNERVTFSGNYASADSTTASGGAISCSDCVLALSENGSITFSDNYAQSNDSSVYNRALGGAICSFGTIALSGNEDVSFSGNYASCDNDAEAVGGAIYGEDIGIQNNGSVMFKQNYEKSGSTYRLRGLYATGNTVLSAASGNCIEFQESMYVGGKLELNNIYTNKSGIRVAQTGDIIYTGEYVAEHLGAIKSDYTEEELKNSQTSVVRGMTTLYDGRLIIRDGAILSGAGLTVASSVSGYSTPTVLIENAKLNHAGATVSFASGTLLEANGQSEISCNNLTMASGSALTLHATGENMSAAVLRVYGSFTMGDSLTLNISFNDDMAEAGTYKLLQVTILSDSSNWITDKITINGLDGTTVNYEDLYWDANVLKLKLTNKNIWVGGKGASWVQGLNAGWQNYETFEAGNRVVFNTKGRVKIVGGVEPASVLVDVEKSLTFSTSYNKKTGLYSGAIVGDGCVVKRGKGTLTLNDGNEYTGGTFIEAGTVKAKGATSFGTGAITLSGGAVDLASKAVANDIVLEGAAAVKGGKKFAGSLDVSAALLTGTSVNIAEGQTATLHGGTHSASLYGNGTVIVDGRVSWRTGSITTAAMEITGSSARFTAQTKGLVMNSKKSSIVLSDGGTLISQGKISAYALTMSGEDSLLDVTNQKPVSVSFKGDVSFTDAHKVKVYGAFSANQLTAVDSILTFAPDRSATKPKAQSVSLKGKGVLNTISGSEVDIVGKMSVTGNLQLTDSDVTLHDVAGATKPKAQGLTVKGELAVEDDSALVMTGTLSAGALSATDSTIAIAAEEGLAAQSLKLTRKEIIKGTPQDNILTNCDVYVNGSMSVAGNLQLQNSDIYLRDYSGKNKAKGLSVKGDLTVGSGSVLSLTGALSAKNLTLENGSSLTLGSAKFSTVKVGGALTLKGEVLFDLGFTVTEKDVAKGKEYTLFTFKSLVGDVSNLTLDYDGVYTLALNTKKTAILLTVKDAAAWNAYVADVQEALKKDEPKTEVNADESAVADETVDAEDLLLKPVAAAADIDPLLVKVADTLVQSTWGTVGASRAFGETIAGRGRHATLLDDGKGAAWLSVMGGSSRISSAEGHNGADFTLSGAAFGVEGRVGEKSTLGVAIGNSWGKVSTFSAFPVDQDSMHVGIYGNHTLTKRLTLSWMATHTRTESEATILGAPYSWSQDALQLDARLTWGKSISEKTAVSAFAGLQYLATDSGECSGLKTGSLQNLRAELGVGASHKLGENTLVFGELSFIGDMVRNNPTAAIGDERTHGTNPGRVGLNLSVGAQHQLSEDWSLNASYSLELMENSTSHSLNVGASYSF